MDIRDYLDGARGEVSLPSGMYRFDKPIPSEWEGLIIKSEDPKNPATLESLVVYAAGVSIDNVSFSDENKSFARSAVLLRGYDCSVIRCQFLPGYQFGIVSEYRSIIEANTILGFSDDGIQFCGDGTQIKRNTIGLLASEVRKDKAHKDCMQGWAGDINSPFRSVGRFDAAHSLKDVVITDNHLFDRPGSTLQGITFFDGLADNWDVSNNTIQLFGPHPLTIMGLRSGQVENNIFTPNQKEFLPPARQWLEASQQWRSVTEHGYLRDIAQC